MLLKKITNTLLCFTFIVLNSAVQADDSDIYFSSDSIVNPNVLFVLDSSGSMQVPVAGDSLGRDRMEVMQDSLSQVLGNVPPFLNVGLMNFAGHNESESVNGPSFPVSPIDDPALPIVTSNVIPNNLKKANHQYRGMFDVSQDNIPDPADGTVSVREFLQQIGNNWEHKRITPIADALYEAARYYRGEEVDWGKLVAADPRAAHPSTYNGYMYDERSVTANQSCTYGNTCEGSACNGKTTNSCTTKTKDVTCYNNTSCGTSCVPDGNYSSECRIGQSCGTSCSNFSKTINYTSSSDQGGCTPKTSRRTVTYCVDNKYDLETGQCLAYAQREETSTYYECSRTETWQSCTGTRYVCKADVQECLYDECVTQTTYGNWTRKNSPIISYKSPIELSCQKSFIVLLSDGGPNATGRDATKKGEAKGKIKNLAKKTACKTVDNLFDEDDELRTYPKTSGQVETNLPHGECGPELTESLATMDQIDDAILENEQTISTFTIGFGLKDKSVEEGYLKLLAKKGQGEYFAANDANSLVKAFNDILTEIGSSASSYSSPTYSVNQATQFSHKNDVFLPVFSVSNFPRWSGNLKKLKLENGQLQGASIPGDMTNLIPAVDETGVFVEEVSDLWSKTEKDGGNVTEGGVANLLEAADRKLYSNLTGDQNIELTIATNHIKSGNITGDHLGVDPNDTGYINKLVTFIQGYEEDGVTSRYHMGDIMHSKPVVISHDTSTEDKTIFVATNEGYLHAFNADTGKERFAFMPRDLLKNIDKQYQNNEPRGHVYGLDGEITVWKHDANKDGKISGAEDFVYLFFGMRRGGRHVYAMDVTNLENPKLLWKIEGGEGQFTELGQTWSKPALVKLHSPNEDDKGKLIDVLVFGGGYDPALDEEDVSARIDDSMGRGVYIVNAKTGKLIWSDTTSFSHSIPTEIRILDMDKNGSIDRLYFADTGGNIWRADLDIDIRDGYDGVAPTLYNISKAKVSKFAELGGSGSDKRKFFNEPDISLVKHNGKQVLMVSIGSGYRARPLNNAIDDRFYVLIDENVKTLPENTFSILENELANIETLSGESIITKQIEEKQAGRSLKGWYYNMPNNGEKILASSRTFLGKVMFTTFTSEGVSGDACTTPPSSGRAYVLNILTGESVLDLNRDGSINQSAEDKSIIAGANEILGTPQLVFSSPKAADGSDCTENDCRHYVNIRVGKKLTPIGDRSNSNDDDPISSLDLGKILPRSYWLDHNAVEQ